MGLCFVLLGIFLVLFLLYLLAGLTAERRYTPPVPEEKEIVFNKCTGEVKLKGIHLHDVDDVTTNEIAELLQSNKSVKRINLGLCYISCQTSKHGERAEYPDINLVRAWMNLISAIEMSSLRRLVIKIGFKELLPLVARALENNKYLESIHIETNYYEEDYPPESTPTVELLHRLFYENVRIKQIDCKCNIAWEYGPIIDFSECHMFRMTDIAKRNEIFAKQSNVSLETYEDASKFIGGLVLDCVRDMGLFLPTDVLGVILVLSRCWEGVGRELYLDNEDVLFESIRERALNILKYRQINWFIKTGDSDPRSVPE